MKTFRVSYVRLSDLPDSYDPEAPVRVRYVTVNAVSASEALDAAKAKGRCVYKATLETKRPFDLTKKRYVPASLFPGPGTYGFAATPSAKLIEAQLVSDGAPLTSEIAPEAQLSEGDYPESPELQASEYHEDADDENSGIYDEAWNVILVGSVCVIVAALLVWRVVAVVYSGAPFFGPLFS